MKIQDIQVIVTQPAAVPLVMVKVITSEPGLHGLGCATFTWRYHAVVACIEKHLKPYMLGRDPAMIEEHWNANNVGGYWRNGPVVNNAISGVDMALWDIKGKLAGLPCYQLWGGASRSGATVYVHADGRDESEVLDNARRYYEQGFRHVRCQIGTYQGVALDEAFRPAGSLAGDYFSPADKLRRIPRLFARLRAELPEDIELLHDVHERLAPTDAVWFAKALEPYRLFFLEDLLAPEDIDAFQMVRSQCAIPLAMGELYSHPLECHWSISRRLIDFLRVHTSAMGGVTPCLKLAHLCEPFAVRTAWHGPPDVSPVGMAANVHMDIHQHNFGIQEWSFRTELEHEMFDGIPRVERGHAYLNDRPGWGIELNEAIAAKYPPRDELPRWTEARLPDGSIGRP